MGGRILTRTNGSSVSFDGMLSWAARFMEKNQIYDVNLWKKFVNVFRTDIDSDGRWRAEYWGKMMRGASMVVSYTKNNGMYLILEDSVRDLLTVQEKSGRVSTYPDDDEFRGWDMWGRKYVLLGLQYFLEICRDDSLRDEIINFMCAHADYILDKVGDGDGKKNITETSCHWLGMNSCSILEPFVRLYEITGEERYLDFAAYIVSTGFVKDGSLIELALEDKLAPYQYPTNKAYEMMSCFEGLYRYYLITGNEEYKIALKRFGKKILETEISIIGSSGCTHELFDHTTKYQTKDIFKDTYPIMQETCVTVTWMNFATSLLELTGDVEYADEIEHSFYNAYLGAFNTERNTSSNSPKIYDVPQVMPVDSYSPLTPDVRGKAIGGYCPFPDKTFYGCCACIAAAGAGIIPRFALMQGENGDVINFYENGTYSSYTPSGSEYSLILETKYPLDGYLKFTLSLPFSEAFDLTFRIPSFAKDAEISVNGIKREAHCGYHTESRLWSDGDTVEIYLPMNVRRITPPEYAVRADQFVGYCRGPIVLAADARLVSPDSVIDINCSIPSNAAAQSVLCDEIRMANLCLPLTDVNGNVIRLIDYASAGKTWDERSKTAAWMLVKPLQ